MPDFAKDRQSAVEWAQGLLTEAATADARPCSRERGKSVTTILITPKADERDLTIRRLNTRVRSLRRELADTRERDARLARQVEELQALVADLRDLRGRWGK